MRILHTMIRVGDLERSIKFYTEVLGMKLLRKKDYPGGRFTLAFVGYGPESEQAVIELTQNWDTARYDLSSVRLATISGEAPAQRDLEDIVAATGARVASLYLSSEGGCGCGVLATNADLMGRGKFASTGKPVIGADLRIVAPAGSVDDILPAGEVGEILVRGPSLALGYWKDAAQTRARFVEGWWRSGDMGFVDAEGDLFITGRIDNLINSGGIKVHAEEIERALLGHPRVVQAAVVGQPDAQWGQRIEAFVVLRGDGIAPDALEAHCRAAGLAGFKLPKAFHRVDGLPTGPTGKLYRRALRADH